MTARIVDLGGVGVAGSVTYLLRNTRESEAAWPQPTEAVPVRSVRQGSRSERTTMIAICTDTFEWEIDSRGRTTAFRDVRTGTDCLACANRPVAALHRRAEAVHPETASLRGAELDLTFTDGSRVALHLQHNASHVTLTVSVVEAEPFDRLDFVDVPLSLEPAADPDAFCACTISRNLRTRVDAVPGPQSRLAAACYPRLGSVGASVAVAAARFCNLRTVLQQVVTEADELPHSPLGGPWALDAPENRNSYLFGVATEETVDEWIALCRDFGMGQLHFCGGGAFRLGDYDPGTALFPRGVDSVRAVVDKLHAAGLHAGLHTLSFSIAKNSRYVTPVPDPRLGADRVFTLAADLDATAVSVPVIESTAGMPSFANYASRSSVTLMIGEELIDYGAVRDATPYALTECQRGAYGTSPSAHPAGAPVRHLKACWGMFAPDGEAGLFTEITENIANLINAADFDMVYLDGLDGAHILRGEELRWHYGGRFAFEVFRRLNRPIIMEMAAFLHHLWFVRSRMGAWDNASRGHKLFIDLHCRSNANFHRIFLPGHLGWWAPRVSSGAKDETTYGDDVAYLCTKALAGDIGFSLQGVSPQAVASVANLRRVAPIFRRHEAVRRSGLVPEGVRRELARPGVEFELDDSDPEKPVFFRLQRHVHHTALPGAGGTKWEVVNEFQPQRPRLRIEALWSAGDCDCPEAATLASFAGAGEFSDNGPVRIRVNSGLDYDYPAAAPGMSAELVAVAGAGPDGGAAARFCARRAAGAGCILSSAPDDEFSVLHHGERFHRPRQASWVRVGKQFPEPLDLGERQAMGLWVHGDGKGEWLNVQLRSRGRFMGYSDFYVPITFVGWRYIELIEPESDRFADLSWPYSRAVYKLHRHGTEYDSVSNLHLWLNNVPEGGSVEVMLSPIRALPVLRNRIRRPVLVLNGQATVLPVELESGMRVEVKADVGIVYGPKGERLQEFRLEAPLPELAQGSNAVAFECDSALPRPRARVSLVTRAGEPVH